GKLDRRALPEPEEVRGGEGEAPRPGLEEWVAGVFRDLLGVAEVGRESSFFALGGHSLLATQLQSRLRAELGRELALATVFEEPTVAGLASRLVAAGASTAPPLVRREGQGPLPLSFAQERLWFLAQLEPSSSWYHVPLVATLRGRLDVAAWRRALTGLAERHEGLRTRFPAREGRPEQEILPPGPVALPVVDLSGLAREAGEAEGERQLSAAMRRPFDLAAAPPWRALLLRRDAHDHGVCLTLHHVVSDGWSNGVLIEELAALYRSASTGEAATLAPLPVQYADFALWQRQWLAGEELERQLGHWRTELAGLPPLLELATDRPRPAVLTAAGGFVPLVAERELASGLAALARSRRGTAFMAWWSAFALLLWRWSGQRDVAVGTPIANRGRREVEGLIGFFVNTLVMRLALDPRAGFASLLAQARERSVAAWGHQDLPFEKLVEALAPERSLSATPLFQVMLTWRNFRAASLELAGLELVPREVELGLSKFDLTLTLTESGEGVEGGLTFRQDLWDRSTVERMAAHLLRLAAGAAAEPERPLSSLPWLSPAEQ
ncbi:MAG TPA: condensation domain-containing protein, partial [Thermoanaerobaculia bacterium]|nr:condensation domain-containing protein [Thermoanaerobaculia bacterium]